MTPSDVKIVAENINDFIEVPDGINRLRKAVLTLAVSGKLVSQDKNEGDANDILFSENSKKKSQPIDQLPFNVPQTWQWVRLGDIGNTQTGSTPKQSGNRFAGGTIPFVRPDNIKSLSISETKDKLSVEDISNGGTLMQKKSLLMVCIGSIGKVGVAYQDVSFNQQINAIHPHDKVHIEYLLYCTASGYFQEFAWKLSSKTTLPILNKSKWESIPVPIPPYKEQERIVEKVKEVLKKLSELESQKNERDLVRSRLTRSAMQALGSADSKVAFEQLTELIKTSQDVKELENAILTLAVSGQLVIQDDSEGSANDLYKKIQSEIKTNLKGKEQKLVTAVSADEIPFEIPESWRWVRLIEIGKLDTGKTPRTNVTGNYDGDIPFIGPGDVQNGTINSYSKLVTVQGASESKYLYPGDVLMVCIGGTIGKTAYVNETYTFNQQINKITPFHTDGRYLSFVFKTEYFQKLVWGKASGGATPLVNLTRWSSCIVPLPPLAEQKRIVAKVEELLKMLNSLRSIIDD